MSDSNPGPAGWQPDPTGKHDHRYWDGSQWTENVSDAGVASTDPYEAPAAAPPYAPEPGPTDPTVADASTPPPDPTAAWSSGAPPPPTAMPPVAGGDDGGGGSKRGLLIGGAILAVVAVIVAVLALGGGDDESDHHAKLVAALTDEDQGGLSAKDADCVADYIVEHVDGDTLDDIDYESNDTPDEIADDLGKAVLLCDVSFFGDESTTTTESSEDTTTTTESTSDTTTTTGSSGFTDSGIDYGTYKDVIVQSLTQAGLDDDQADCLADQLIDAMESGEISQDDILSTYQEFFSDCDIDPADFSN